MVDRERGERVIFLDRPDVLPSKPQRRRRKSGSRGAETVRSGPDAKEGLEGLQAGREILLRESPRESAAEKPGVYRFTPAGQVSSELTQLGAQMRLEMMGYATGRLAHLGEEWSYFEPDRRFSVSLTWQYLVTGSLPALHRHYLLERMTREQCARYESFLKEMRRNRGVIERVGFFPPWRTLESVTAEAVLEREIPGKLARHSQSSRPAGRRPDGRRSWHKRLTDRLKGVPRKGS